MDIGKLQTIGFIVGIIIILFAILHAKKTGKQAEARKQQQQQAIDDYNNAKNIVETELKKVDDFISYLKKSELPFFTDEELMIERIQSMVYEAQQALAEGTPYDYNENINFMHDSLNNVYSKATQRENEYYHKAYEAKFEREKEEREKEKAKQMAQDASFFSGCQDVAAVKKRYRDLCKVYHPDMGNGDPVTFGFIQTEYEKLLKSFGS